MIDKITIKPIYVLIALLFASAMYLSLIINYPDGINFFIIHLMMIIINIIGLRIFYVKNLRYNINNKKNLSFRDYTFNRLINHIIYLVFIFIFFTPVPILHFLLYYILLVVFIAIVFAIENLMVLETYDY